jgi:hypothetical protein
MGDHGLNLIIFKKRREFKQGQSDIARLRPSLSEQLFLEGNP